MVKNSLVELDRHHLIHPVASYRAHEARGATILNAGDGIYLTDSEGNRLLDGFAGLWCVNAGYGQRSVVEAATEQMLRLPYATGYFHFSTEAPILLAARLAELTPPGLDRVYFTLGGSDSVDSAVRFITYYFNAIGKPDKKQFISLRNGYHGSSSFGSGLTAIPAFHEGFDMPLPSQHKIASPYPYRHPAGGDPQALIAQSVAELEAEVARIGPERVAAFFCEPVQGSGGVIVPPAGWLAAMRQACRRLDILFVADEVITGFGRTGPLFACEHEDVVPDMMTVAKGLTSGYLPMGAVIMSEQIYAAIADGAGPSRPVGHGVTYSAHPVSAAVGLEVLRLYTEGGIIENGQRAGVQLMDGLARLAEHPLVGDVRGQGMLAALELVCDKAEKAKFAAETGIAAKLAAAGYANRLLFRAFADGTIGLAPPLVCTPGEISELLARLERTLDDLLEDGEIRAAMK
ncbi:aminotransferase class III-fold pyridoxal phosphate-dependent enzyme [Pelagibacterium sp.]|uniref:aminotransferase class III-fold pyridoxal phosphate-dependent enzyme n=1 Tax=Pelagibacterium sp. TaxID=1967288 RepID=UPI003BACAF1D